MENVLWIAFCMLAAVGFVQILGWFICGYNRPRSQPPCYTVVPLSSEVNQLEVQLRHCLRCRSWNGTPGAIIVLPERELSEEGKAICERLLAGVSGVFLCYPGELVRTIENFNELETQSRTT